MSTRGGFIRRFPDAILMNFVGQSRYRDNKEKRQERFHWGELRRPIFRMGEGATKKKPLPLREQAR